MDTNSLSIGIIIDYYNSVLITFYYKLSTVIDYCKLLPVINNIFNCKWAVARWQWLLCMYINMK